ncbi:putative prophage LambdaCh01, recombination protein Bet [Campylobacter sputorum subsp. bubulus]|uniref:RNA pseudouridylate synthase n=1 Tax=Campylobacter sputorum subsp. sputorum TaxID=32024 RepID=A0A381DJT6_9BACT|nr:RluA family pseudouridine synthase [Campylobacter sputorum]ASM35932.1 23S rRNA pseudouridine synthase, RluD family [Campylobacter sputorum aubsp. sputorum RM3237]ASM37616.1 23S rRNA pseudouridine synthase, RluD family [Campylobacter sputorum bv. faecalis CCUG 20703]KAB0582336.1 RluA family pseudouridine synthase [Campylobacter sputorum subsp. sputorum]QEL06122.1 RNA pseudouridine synthase [Campylobacter sputorum subsp. sputorum]SUX09235.1 putative prophage LambdaCh01, recombination protein 
MPYKKIKIDEVKNLKAYEVLIKNGFSKAKSQQLIDKGRVFCDDKLIKIKNEILNGKIFLIDYECNPKGLKPIFENSNFAVFDKPSGVLSHPNGRNSSYNLYDEIWHLYGKSACVAHRLDKETSGLILVCKNLNISREFKTMFESRAVKKEYIALAKGKIESEFIVDEPITKSDESSEVKIRMCIDENGKNAITKFIPLEFYHNINATLIKAIPLTGRQHQIRLHLFHVKHKILGEPLYGLETKIVEDIMDEKLSTNERIKFCGAKRLCLHASKLEFNYKNEKFEIKTDIDFKKEFLNSLSL